jgi:ABC-2 type transport system ATP-binding protein
MVEPAIQLRKLTRCFETKCAVKGVDLDVGRGELFTFVGPDGAGKTTLLRMLCGVLEPTSGSVRLLSMDLKKHRKRIQRRLGYLPQRFSLYGDLTVDENLEFFADIHEMAEYRKLREELLSLTRLTPFRRRLADRLSGGMKQKLALACTLIHRPDVILLDEPTTGVDPVSRRDFWSILFRLLGEGMTLVMSTPYLDEAERSGRVGLLDNGRLLAAAEPAVLKARMHGTLYEMTCSDTRKAKNTLEESGISSIAGIQVFGDRLNILVEQSERARRGDGGLDDVRNSLGKKDIEIYSLRMISPNLENVFLSLTEKQGKGQNKKQSYDREGGS